MLLSRRRSMIAAAALMAAVCLPCFANEDWPSFRGPTADGRSDSKGLPVKWSETENVVWKTAIHGKGWSSPVVLGKQIWMTTATPDAKELFAVCVDRDSGKIIHDVKVFEIAKPQYIIAYNSAASPTPVVEEGRVYVHFGAAGTAALDAATGKVLWTRPDFVCDHFRGAGSSPIVYGNLLYLTFDGFDVQYVAALDKATGKTVWKTDRNIKWEKKDGDWHKAYSTPIVIDVGGKKQLISPAAQVTQAFDPEKGDEIWRVEQGGMNVAQRPLYAGGKLFLNTGNSGRQLFTLKPEGTGDITKTGIDWAYTKGVPTRPGLLLDDGKLYMVSDGGVTTCLDAATGKELKKGRLNGKFTASPVCAEGRIYFCDEDKGNTYVVEAGSEMKELSVNALADGCMSSPAIAGKALFIRTKTHLYRIEQK